MNFKEIRNLVKMLNRAEEEVEVKAMASKFEVIAVIDYFHGEKSGHLPVYTQDVKTDSPASLARFKDGTIGIVINKEELGNFNLLYASIAHELGHYIAGHYDSESIKETHVDRNLRKQKLYFDKYQSGEHSAEGKYRNAVAFGLIRGGVMQIELEADMAAINFAGVPLMTTVHSVLTGPTITTKLEKYNRVKRLAELKSPETLGKFSWTNLPAVEQNETN